MIARHALYILVAVVFFAGVLSIMAEQGEAAAKSASKTSGPLTSKTTASKPSTGTVSKSMSAFQKAWSQTFGPKATTKTTTTSKTATKNVLTTQTKSTSTGSVTPSKPEVKVVAPAGATGKQKADAIAKLSDDVTKQGGTFFYVNGNCKSGCTLSNSQVGSVTFQSDCSPCFAYTIPSSPAPASGGGSSSKSSSGGSNSGGGSGSSIAPFDYSISLSPVSGSVVKTAAGSKSSTTVAVTKTAGPAHSVSFSCLQLPAEATCTFTPLSCSPDSTCTSKLDIAVTQSTPSGLYSVKAVGTTASGLVKDASYSLSVSGTCNSNNVCNYPDETQLDCSADCKTIVSLSPNELAPGEPLTVTVEFWDGRYSTGESVELNLRIQNKVSGASIDWKSSNGCAFGSVSKAPYQWPSSVSENGHFKTTFTCNIPLSVVPGQESLVVTPKIP